MEHKIFYGEYSLGHWIDLMLKGRIVIPEFQRAFVWKEEDVKKLIKSFEDNSFVPPVMVGAYKENENEEDYIIDGQQRLSSILLAWLNVFPTKKNQSNKNYANSNDDGDDDDDDDDNLSIDWNLNEIQDAVKIHKTTDREILVKNLEGYDRLDLSLNDNFLEYRLGFSYIKPGEKENHDNQKKFYAKLFKNINTTGIKLLDMEARNALYWFGGSKLKEFFDPGFTKNITINNKRLDFARILALLSECKKHENDFGKIIFHNIAKRYSGKKIEQYIIMYIESVISENKERFDISTFSSNNMKKIEECINHIGKKEYNSIIEADYELFGLIYFTLFKGKNIDVSKKDELKIKIKEKIDKREWYEKKTPSALKYIRGRLEDSIAIYSNFIKR